jgi:CubicO group peptidase (beta-lactamase class C family)
MRSEVGRPPEYAAAVAYPLNAAPGERFLYGPAPYQLFGEIMRRKLVAAGQPDDPVTYLKRRVLAPIGLGGVSWRRTPGGDPLLPQGALFTAREWARFGEFIRAGARHEGRPLVDEKTFRELFRPSRANPAYGLTWWLPNPSPSADVVTATVDLGRHAAEVPRDTVVAAGAGNQRLYVIPSLKLTVVRQATIDMQALARRRATGGGPPLEGWSDTEFLKRAIAVTARAEGGR